MKTTTWMKLMAMMVALFGSLAQAQEAQMPREVPAFQLAPPLSGGEIGERAVLVGLTDLGLRTGEQLLEVVLAVPALTAGFQHLFQNGCGDAACVHANDVGSGLVAVDLVLVLVAPAINALIEASFSDRAHGYGRRLGPLMAVSYGSHLLVDVLSLALAGTSYAAPVYLAGMAMGSVAMGGAYALTAAAHPTSPALAARPPANDGPIPTAVPQGATFHF